VTKSTRSPCFAAAALSDAEQIPGVPEFHEGEPHGYRESNHGGRN